MLVLEGADILFLFFAGCFALVLALGQIIGKRDDGQWNMFFLLLVIAANQLSHAFGPRFENEHVWLPRLTIVFSILLMGPLFYRYVRGMLETTEDAPAIPYPIIAALMGGFALFVLFEYMHSRGASSHRLFQWSGVLAIFVFLVFSALLVYHARAAFQARDGGLSRVALFLIAVTGLIALTSMVGSTAVPSLRRVAQMGVGVCALLVYLISRRYPRLLDNLREQIARRRYIKSGLHRLDVEDVIRRMNQLMNEERLYALEGLSLPQLAEALEIQRHELSEILNSVLRRGFHGFVNEYRVNAACEMLRDEPDRSTLSIGMAVGFSSNSAFYKAFKQFKQVSPARFRDESH